MTSSADVRGERLPVWLDRVADELNALLWAPPFSNRGQTDLGWACRDHAALLGRVLLAHGHEVTVVDGNNVWVHSSGPGGPSWGLGQRPDEPISHTWLRVDGARLDVSARLTRTVVPGGGLFPGIPQQVRRLDDPPDGVVVLFPSSESEYARDLHAAQRRAGTTGLYWERSARLLTDQDLDDPHTWPKSPTSDQVVGRHGLDIYRKAVTHLLAVVDDPARSLARKQPSKAWIKIAALPAAK